MFFVVGGNGTGRFESVNPGVAGANGGGGGASGSGGGGGASDVRTCGLADTTCNTLLSRLLVAGGGGGMGNGGSTNAGTGGNAGGGPGVPGPGAGVGSAGATGGSGIISTNPLRGGTGGGGGTLSAGGAGGADDVGGVAGSGSLGAGGAAQSADPFGNKGGGGGGGYYGGGAGGYSLNQGSGGGGGGGASFAASGITNVTFGLDTTRAPAIRVTFTDPPANGAPIARNDQYTTNEDAVLDVPINGVLKNDNDPEGDALSSVVVTPPAHGALVLNPNGSLSYTPAADYNGPDSFTYKARDAGGAESAPATVALTVSPVNDAPVAVDDVATTNEDTPVVIAVVDNDTDVDNPNSDLQVVGFATFTGGSPRVLDDRRHIEFDPLGNFNSDNRPHRVLVHLPGH